MFSARWFVLLWAALTAAVIGYALLDLQLTPSLRETGELQFSMQPDLREMHQMWHWGGRLVREGHWQLLIPNALALGGLGALTLHGLARFIARRRSEPADEAQSLAPTGGHSVPPPPL